jgi:hypothetical protein
VPTGKLVTDLLASPSHDPDGPSDGDVSTVPTIYLFRRYYVRGSGYRLDNLGVHNGALRDFLPLGHVLGSPTYP